MPGKKSSQTALTISLRSAAKLQKQGEPLTEADLYDEDGLPV